MGSLYWFFTEDGVILAQALCDTLSLRGAQAVQDEFPTCADLFLHVAAHIVSWNCIAQSSAFWMLPPFVVVRSQAS